MTMDDARLGELAQRADWDRAQLVARLNDIREGITDLGAVIPELMTRLDRGAEATHVTSRIINQITDTIGNLDLGTAITAAAAADASAREFQQAKEAAQ